MVRAKPLHPLVRRRERGFCFHPLGTTLTHSRQVAIAHATACPFAIPAGRCCGLLGMGCCEEVAREQYDAQIAAVILRVRVELFPVPAFFDAEVRLGD
ncbi:hypothetical protein SY87_16180 [Burkholderia pseudomallei]|nr:hypothetical protein SY87_16180 [Burkholderia pseudomallei]